jgi:hypothetical protein
MSSKCRPPGNLHVRGTLVRLVYFPKEMRYGSGYLIPATSGAENSASNTGKTELRFETTL